MDVGNHQIPDGVVHEPVAAQWRQTGESSGHDQHREMPAPVSRACVSGMQAAVVDDLEALRVECLESLTKALRARRSHGSTRTNGLTS